MNRNLVTKIEIQKRNKDRVNIYVNNDYFISCDIELVYRHGIKKGEVIEKDKLETVINEDNYIKAKSRSLRFLEKTYKTEKEVIDKLKEEGYENNIIHRVISFLKEYNFINDERYVELFIKEKLKKWGEKRIKYELFNKGIDDKIILDKISNIDIEEQFEVAFQLALKKYNCLIKSESDLFKLKRKLSNYMLRKGYDYSTINSIIRQIEEVE